MPKKYIFCKISSMMEIFPASLPTKYTSRLRRIATISKVTEFGAWATRHVTCSRPLPSIQAVKHMIVLSDPILACIDIITLQLLLLVPFLSSSSPFHPSRLWDTKQVQLSFWLRNQSPTMWIVNWCMYSVLWPWSRRFLLCNPLAYGDDESAEADVFFLLSCFSLRRFVLFGLAQQTRQAVVPGSR